MRSQSADGALGAEVTLATELTLAGEVTDCAELTLAGESTDTTDLALVGELVETAELALTAVTGDTTDRALTAVVVLVAETVDCTEYAGITFAASGEGDVIALSDTTGVAEGSTEFVTGTLESVCCASPTEPATAAVPNAVTPSAPTVIQMLLFRVDMVWPLF